MSLDTKTTLTGLLPCKLVDKDDPEKMGRCKLRFMDQSEAEIPDDKLPWTTSLAQLTGGVGHFELGKYFPGQWLMAQRMPDIGFTTTIPAAGPIISSPGKKK